jgi:hypothetical protein
MKTPIWIATALIALLLGTEAAAASCEDVLKTGAYNCRFLSQTGENFEGCMRFVVPGVVGEFDIRSHIEFPAGARNLLGGCSCRAKVGLWVEFDEATTFDCLEPRQNALLISGQASILRIAKGQTMTPDGDSMIFTCERSLLAKSPSVACPACVSAGEPCGGDICCEGLVCRGVIGGPPPTCQPQ